MIRATVQICETYISPSKRVDKKWFIRHSGVVQHFRTLSIIIIIMSTADAAVIRLKHMDIGEAWGVVASLRDWV